MEYKELRKLINKSLSALIISGVFIILGLCFIPLTNAIMPDGTKIFLPGSIEAIFMYALLGIGLGFMIYGFVYLGLYFKNKKNVK